eukprot:TRINITY_DN2173_c0_g1_i3.p1 TRINITY_DN2173_c0_g1~~TRINITY_DN2173_c0_g1_i3.p1  ORF type:complete len:291 (+),score=59.06 TRINITY_DN2173_c0_g1_i3:3-875(+)
MTHRPPDFATFRQKRKKFNTQESDNQLDLLFPHQPTHSQKTNQKTQKVGFQFIDTQKSRLKRSFSQMDDSGGVHDLRIVSRQKIKDRDQEINFFNFLPDDVIMYSVMLSLDLFDLIQFSMSCSRMYRLNENRFLWMSYFEKIWGVNPKLTPYYGIIEVSNWKEMIIKRMRFELDNFFEGDVHILPDSAEIFQQWGDLLMMGAERNRNPVEACEMVLIALQEYDTALSLDPTNYELYICYGDTLADSATYFLQHSESLKEASEKMYINAQKYLPQDNMDILLSKFNQFTLN